MGIYKLIHLGAVLISISGFVVRGYWRLTGSHLLQNKFFKIAPHIVDTVLLASAIMLALQIQQYPFVHGWLTAKVIALIIYILLGMAVMRFASTFKTQLLAYIGAIMTFMYIISVALTRQVIPF